MGAMKSVKAKQELVVPDEVVPRAKAGRLEASALAKVQEAKQLKVTNAASYEDAAAFCLGLKEGEKAIEELYADPVKKAHELHKALTGARKKLLEPLQEARSIVQGKMGTWSLEQQRKAQEEAQREAEEQRKLELKQAKKEGDRELVKELQAAPVVAAPVVNAVPKVEGVVTRKVWRYEVVKESEIPRQFMEPNLAKIKEHVLTWGEEKPIPGVRVWEEVQNYVRS